MSAARAVSPARSTFQLRGRAEVAAQRRPRPHRCLDHLIAAPLWPKYGINLGTLLRTCDAVGACLAVPRRPWIPDALDRGNTLRQPSCVHWVDRPLRWLERQRAGGSTIVGVELVEGATRLADLPAARRRTVMVLGHESDGIPENALGLLDSAVEIPMIGCGTTLNVAVAGSLVLYRLAGLM
jgi:tRNA (guanosine-2'-O-)-methyltransferase